MLPNATTFDVLCTYRFVPQTTLWHEAYMEALPSASIAEVHLTGHSLRGA